MNVEWRVEPAADTTLITVLLVGTELARTRLSSRTGISVVTERSEFFSLVLGRYEMSAGGPPITGSGSGDIPAGLVPSFAAKLNEIAWAVVIEATRAAGDSLRLEFPLNVQPVRG